MAQSTNWSEHEQQLNALEDVLQVLREHHSQDSLLETALYFLRSELDYSLIWIGLHNSTERALIGKGGETPKGDGAFLRQKYPLVAGSLLDQVVVQQQPISVADLREEHRAGEWRQIAQKLSIQGCAIYPIRYREGCLGVVLLGSTLWGNSIKPDERSRILIMLGTLGAVLHQVETGQQSEADQSSGPPILPLLHHTQNLSTLQERLQAVAQLTQQYISPSRTSIYWFEPQQRYFWRRVINQPRANPARNSGGAGRFAKDAEKDLTQAAAENYIAAQEVGSFYQALTAGQVISIGEIHSTLNASVPLRLMQQIRAQSLLAAPILSQGQLQGFLAVEGSSPRLWEEEEKNFVQAGAQIIGLAAPLERVEQVVEETQKDQALLSGLTHAICSEQDWKETIKSASEQLCKHFKVERVFLLLHDADTGMFNVYFQNQSAKSRVLPDRLSPLQDIDWQMFERSTQAIAIENLQDDLRLITWRELLLALGIRSLLVCHTAIGRSLEALLLVGHEAVRTWSQRECETVTAVAQQLGIVTHQWQLQLQSEQQQRIHQDIQQGLMSIQKTHNLDRLEQTALQNIMQLLQVPLVALVTWSPGQKQGTLIAPPIHNPKFALQRDTPINVDRDPLIQTTLSQFKEGTAADPFSGLTMFATRDLAPSTRTWLSGSGVGQVITMALQTDPEYEPSGILLVADQADRSWSELQLGALVTLINHLAWAHRSISLTQVLKQGWQELESLNWYKQRRLEDVYRALAHASNHLTHHINQQSGTVDSRLLNSVRQIQSTLASLPPLIKREAWQLQTSTESLTLAALVKRSLERVDHIIKQRQIWTQVHNQGNITVVGDVTKIDLVLYESLLAACQRVATGGRIDIWCQKLDSGWLELSITDDGNIEPRLLIDLHHHQHQDLLAPSTLNAPPGRHLKAAQSVMQNLGGQADMFKLEDGRTLTRLTIPLQSCPQEEMLTAYEEM
jgi:GAF domain-containing protein